MADKEFDMSEFYSYTNPDPQRVRRIMRLAASKTSDTEIKSWLANDEFGGREREVRRYLAQVATLDPAHVATFTESQIDDEIASRVVIGMMQAIIASNAKAQKAPKTRKRR
jgi:hypothetical protein